jgi:RNA-directed DNA polymerase
MIKIPISLQELRRRIYWKAKSEKEHHFWGIFWHVTKIEVLAEAYRQAKRNGGAPGIDGLTFEDVENLGIESFLLSIRDDLMSGIYKPQANRFVEIPK